MPDIQVIRVDRFGPPEVLVPAAVPAPAPARDGVIITVAAADVLFLDTAIRSGRAAQWFPVRPPYVPGGGVAGVVTATGAGADPAWAGRRVIARTGAGGGGGGYVEQAAVPAAALIPVPDQVSLADAAAVLHAALAAEALAGLAAGRIRPVIGQSVPLPGAAAAHAAIQARAVTGKTLLLPA